MVDETKPLDWGIIDEMKPVDWGIIGAATMMALGAFCPIVRVPIVGSLNYVMGGKGDGIFVVGSSMAIVLSVLFGYRRASALFAGGSLVLITTFLVKIVSGLGAIRADAVHMTKSNPIGAALTNLLSNSVGLEWGWVPLIGGALMVIALALSVRVPKAGAPGYDGSVRSGSGSASFASADRLIAQYLESAKADATSAGQTRPEGFGKRRAPGTQCGVFPASRNV